MVFNKKKEITQEKPKEPPKPHASINGTSFGYTVEARVRSYMPNRPVMIPRQGYPDMPLILTEEWQHVSFWKGNNPWGVPVASCSHDDNLFNMHNLLERTSAIALAYTVAAQHMKSDITAIQVRIRQHKLEYSHKVFHEGEPEELTEHFGKIDKFFAGETASTL